MKRVLLVMLLGIGALSIGIAGFLSWGSGVAQDADPYAREATVDELGVLEFRNAARACAQEGQDGWICMNDLVINAGPKYGIATTLIGLREAIETYPDVYEQNCHRNTHYLGEYAGETITTVPEALKLGGPDCQFGYYHGVIEGYARTTPTLWEEINDLCWYLTDDPNTYLYQECSHSLGHAVVTRTDNNVPEGVEKCRLLERPSDQSACATGVFMSWSNTLDKMIANGEPIEGKWTWANPEKRFENCRAFDDIMAGACVLFFAETVEHDPKGLGGFRSWCVKEFADRQHVLEQCYYGVGRVSGGYEEFFRMGQWDGIIKFCTKDTPYEYARMCAESAYGVAAGFQLDPTMVDKACAAWEGSPHQEEQCALAKQMFASTTADAYVDSYADPSTTTPTSPE